MYRKSVKVHPRVKFRLELAKKIIGVKSESDAISYLLNLYMLMDEGEKISTRMHENILRMVRNIDRQSQGERKEINESNGSQHV